MATMVISYVADILIHTVRGGGPAFGHPSIHMYTPYADRGQIGLLNVMKEPQRMRSLMYLDEISEKGSLALNRKYVTMNRIVVRDITNLPQASSIATLPGSLQVQHTLGIHRLIPTIQNITRVPTPKELT
jgi:hypothetical protein